MPVVFNEPIRKPDDPKFNVSTSKRNNYEKGQSLVMVEGNGIKDIYSVRDRSGEYNLFPAPHHSGEQMTANKFIDIY
jgi:hypothetical protein